MSQPVFIVAALASMLSYGIMNLMMTSTPLAMRAHEHHFNDAAFVLQGHMIGMYGPSFFTGSLINRFGVLQLVLPWTFTPLEEQTRPDIESAARDLARKLNHALLADTTRARVTARCHGDISKIAAPLVARLGPRAHVMADDSLPPTQVIVE